ncbi:MAG: ATP-binding protein [Minicystis sp.]
MTAADGHRGVIGLRVPGSLAYRHLAIRFVTHACKIAQESVQDGDEADFEPEVISAFGEAFNNVAVHGFRDVTPEPVYIEIDWDAEKLVITMTDSGKTFDPASVSPPDLDELPENGMGLFIMTSCMDVVDYQAGPPNVLRMVKMRQRRDGMLPPEPAPYDRAGRDSDGGLGVLGALAGLADQEVARERYDALAESDRGSGIEVIEPAAPGEAGRIAGGWRRSARTT